MGRIFCQMASSVSPYAGMRYCGSPTPQTPVDGDATGLASDGVLRGLHRRTLRTLRAGLALKTVGSLVKG